MHVNQQSSLAAFSLHVIMLHTLKKHSCSFSKGEIISTIEKNSGETGLVQTKDVDEVIKLNSGKDILEKCLNNVARLEIIVRVSKRVHANSTLTALVAPRNKMKHRKITIHFGHVSQ